LYYRNIEQACDDVFDDLDDDDDDDDYDNNNNNKIIGR